MRISDWSSDVCSSDLEGVSKVDRRCWRPVCAACPTRPGPPTLARDRRTLRVSAPPPRCRQSTARSEQKGHARSMRPPDRSWPSAQAGRTRSEEHTSELQSLMRISYAVFCLKKKKNTKNYTKNQ